MCPAKSGEQGRGREKDGKPAGKREERRLRLAHSTKGEILSGTRKMVNV